MDDTACTNRYGFPILVILGIDEYKLRQLVAFALIRDRTMASFASFLAWVKQYLRVGGADSDSEPTPRAFVVDRHDGQLAALRQVFPESRTVFCAKHLGENIRRAMGHQSKAAGAFWDLRHGTITEKIFMEILKAESELYDNGSVKGRMLEFLEENLEHFSPARVNDDTSEKASSRVEGFFGATAVKGI
jgi:hypothetical protein